ncbi:unnamed protein product [Paramecium pentaurelia]|uniref:Uncharacterized protein n=1 Tax=Paramecium pentaurelia TaxID=43138 RepID=A0A8S1YJP9_9CILI|nr:unnamed protein product [Paramecium pentaurelia]
MDINNYYKFQIKVHYVEKKTLDDYSKQLGLISDLNQILEKSEFNKNQNNIKQISVFNNVWMQIHSVNNMRLIINECQYSGFQILLLLDLFNLTFDLQLKINLVYTIKNQPMWKILLIYNMQVINAFEKFQDSCKEFKNNSNTYWILQTKNLLKNLKNTIKAQNQILTNLLQLQKKNQRIYLKF